MADVTDGASMVPNDAVLVPRAALERAAEILERDGDEHGVATELRELLRLAQPPRPFEASEVKVEAWPAPSSTGLHADLPPRGVRVIHLASGLAATCDTERSQHVNRDKALATLAVMVRARYKPILKLPARADGKRVETGPVQFGDDWPGVFLRGDCAGPYAMLLHGLLTGDDGQAGGLTKILLGGLYRELRSATIGPAAALMPTLPIDQ